MVAHIGSIKIFITVQKNTCYSSKIFVTAQEYLLQYNIFLKQYKNIYSKGKFVCTNIQYKYIILVQ